MLRHLFWSAAIGPLAAALTMLATILVALPFLHTGAVKLLPGIQALPTMIISMVVLAYSFGLPASLAFGAVNGLASRLLRRAGVLAVAPIAGALAAIVFALVVGGGRLGSPYELVF